MKIRSILEEREILAFTGLPSTFPKCRISSIMATEFAEMNKCIGQAFYDKMKACVAKYDCEKYDNEKTYSENDTVVWNGVIKIALKENTGVIPDDVNGWGDAPKFKPECKCIETLWCNFLGPFIAWSVVRMNLPFMFRQFSANGIIKAIGSKFEAADIKDFHTVQAAVSREVEQSFLNLDMFIKANNQDGCYDLYKGIAKGCCGECGCLDEVCGCEENCAEIKESDYGYEIG